MEKDALPMRAWIIAAAAVVIGFILFIGLIDGVARCGAGQACLVRNGGPFDDKKIRQTMEPASEYKWIGWWSDGPRHYISDEVQRFYTITADPGRADRGSTDFVEVPTRDGVQVRLEGTIYFRTAFTGKKDDQTLRQFDERFGNRTFEVPNSGDRKHVWEGNDGWSAFLDAQFRPVIDNDIREQIGRFRCDELVSSCSLIQAGQQASTGRRVNVRTQQADNQENLRRIQTAINAGLESNVAENLGGQFLSDFRFVLAKVVLPKRVQDSIDTTQAEFAEVSKARARVQQARFEARRNRLLGRQFRLSPELAQIEMIKAAPEGTQIILNTGGRLGLNVPGR